MKRFNCRCSVIASFDYPANYNHKKPNKDTTIAFDKKGLPAKVEYGSQVLDLKATNYVGVPKVQSLEQVFKDVANRTKETRQRERDTQKTPESIVETAKQIRNEKAEIMHLYDADANLLYKHRGTVEGVDIELSDDIAQRSFGGYDLHNHPAEAGRTFESFSLDDVLNAIDWNLKESLVVTKNYLYSLRSPKTGWDLSLKEKITESYWKTDSEVTKDFYERFRSGELTLAQIKDEVRHSVLKNVAKEFGLRYKRKKV